MEMERSVIRVLDEQTIDKIAAGEVIERPASIVKELVENAIDAGATAVTVEIKDGGISFIRITDNGAGIEPSQIPTAFLRHATSKIRKVEDLLGISSLGFRGEALSSIAAVCQVELITKTPESLTGIRYIIEGGKEKSMDEIGAPSGTTFLVRNIFFNTPARKKFLKTPQTEAGYISDLLERMALSHPEISFKFIVNNQTKLHTSGNHNLKDIIYNIYGRDIAANQLEIHAQSYEVKLHGFIGKPVIARGNRNYENYFVNGRYIKSPVISKAIESAYDSFMMKHKYPFTALHFEMDGSLLDINVHPTKMELRFADNEKMYQFIYDAVREALTHKEMIPQVSADKRDPSQIARPQVKQPIPEPFEVKRRENQGFLTKSAAEKTDAKSVDRMKSICTASSGMKPSAVKPADMKSKDVKLTDIGPANAKQTDISREDIRPTDVMPTDIKPSNIKPSADPSETEQTETKYDNHKTDHTYITRTIKETAVHEQMTLYDDRLLSKENAKEHRIIGQLFDTYWLVEFRDNLFIIDQHAAHEKVLYERTLKSMASREHTSQYLNPPVILTLSMSESILLEKYMDHFTRIGFEIEAFGGKEYALRAVPDNLFGIAKDELFLEMLDSLAGQTETMKTDIINERIATMSCKAAVKGNHKMSVSEIHALIDELMTLDNPYHCPHGRPTIIEMSRYDIEKKFKRIV